MGRDVYYSHVGRHQGQGLEEPSSCYGSCPGKGTAGLSFSYPIRSVENGLLLSFSTSSVCPSPHSPCSRPAAADWSHLSRPMHLPSRSPSQPPSSFDPGGGGVLLVALTGVFGVFSPSLRLLGVWLQVLDALPALRAQW